MFNIITTNKKRTAIEFKKDNYITYEEIDHFSNSTILELQDHGAKKGSVIAITGEKELITYVLIISAIKLGIPYIILDPESPTIRTQEIIKKGSVDLIICSDSFRKTLNSGDIKSSQKLLKKNEI